MILTMAGSLFHEELQSSVLSLRTAIRDMLRSVEADPTRPQDMSRQLKVDKNLAWKVSRLVGAVDAGDALQYLPGDSAMTLLVDAGAKAGASARMCDKVKKAAEHLSKAVREHVGDRPTLELMIDALPTNKGERLLASRKMAFRGNSAIWGMQAKARFQTAIILPNANDPERLDIAILAGWVDLRRIRHDAEWILHRQRQSLNAMSEPVDEEGVQSDQDRTLGLLRRFCSPNMPEVIVRREKENLLFQLGPSLLAGSGASTIVQAWVFKGMGWLHAKYAGETGQFAVGVAAPSEYIVYDIFAHRSCTFVRRANASIHGYVMAPTQPFQPGDRLPIEPTRVDLGQFPPTVSSSMIPNYGEMVDFMFEKLGWNPVDFLGLRFQTEYPPFPSGMLIEAQLDAPPTPPAGEESK